MSSIFSYSNKFKVNLQGEMYFQVEDKIEAMKKKNDGNVAYHLSNRNYETFPNLINVLGFFREELLEDDI